MSHALLEDVLRKEQRRTIGLMSGTSADGLDIACCDVAVRQRSFNTIAAETFPYDDALRNKVLEIARSGNVALAELAALSSYLGHFYAEAIETFCAKKRLSLEEVDLIGSHGQTVAHLSQPVTMMGRSVRGTLQVGDADVIAKRLGKLVVSDFRSGDTALGGSGAPLAPIYHRFRFAQQGTVQAVLNIGGISNVTILSGAEACVASDTGPGNCLIDTVASRFKGVPVDYGGALAAAGSVDRDLLASLADNEMLSRELPTSYDRGELIRLLDKAEFNVKLKLLPVESVLATLTELTVTTIFSACRRLCPDASINRVLVCGGGAHNVYLMRRLAHYFSEAVVETTSQHGSNVDFVEAEAFAYLANLTLEAEAGNLPNITGASRCAVLGKISLP